MISQTEMQERAARRVAHLPAHQITCRYCGEETGHNGSMKGYVHKWGPIGHMFIAKQPVKAQ